MSKFDSFKPETPEKPKRDYSGLKPLGIVALISLLSLGLAIGIMHIPTPEPKVEVRTVVKVDTVVVPGKVINSIAKVYYDVSDANVISVTVTNGVIEVTTEEEACH